MNKYPHEMTAENLQDLYGLEWGDYIEYLDPSVREAIEEGWNQRLNTTR